MDLNVLKSYLVSLGFEVDQPGLRKFQTTLKQVASEVERYTTGAYGIASFFVKAGTAVTGVLSAIATGTVAMMDKVAEADLGYQVFARRMFISTEAAKSLKIATDALGYSLEDIIWGPRELQERFGVLQKDQQTMQQGLGGDFETQMRRIRDIRFEFTRLGVEIQYFGMQLTKTLSKALFGDEDALLGKLQEFNKWFIAHIPEISNIITTYLAPILKDVLRIMEDLWGVGMQMHIEKVGKVLVFVADKLVSIADIVSSHPWMIKLLGAGVGAAMGGTAGAVVGMPLPGAAIGALLGGLGTSWLLEGGHPTDKASIKAAIADAARANGIDPAIALAVGNRESGYNQSAVSSTGALGVMQLMPGTAAGLGVDPRDPGQNVRGGVAYLAQLFNKYHDWRKALEAYNGGPGNVDRGTVSRDAQTYADQILKQVDNYQPISAPGSGSGGVTIQGGINVNVVEPRASKEEVYKATVAAVNDTINKRAVRNQAQFGGAF